MGRITLSGKYLSSNNLVMTNEALIELRHLLAHSYTNAPDLIDRSHVIDTDKNGKRLNPTLCFINIEQLHNGLLYLNNDSGDSINVGDVLRKFIIVGTTFKLQFVQLKQLGMEFTSFEYGSDSCLFEHKDMPMPYGNDSPLSVLADSDEAARIQLTECYLASSLIVIPTAQLDELNLALNKYDNAPDFIDCADIQENGCVGSHKPSDLSYVRISQPHDGSLYLRDGSGHSIELEEVLTAYIDLGSSFKLHYVQLEGHGMQYDSYTFTSSPQVQVFSDFL